jgi:hypothetical protein
MRRSGVDPRLLHHNSHHTNNLATHPRLGPFSQLVNTWPKIMRRNIKQQYAMATYVKAAVGHVFGLDLTNASEEKFVARKA